MNARSVEFSSDYENVGPACAEIMAALTSELCPDKLIELQIALSEALNNVIEHSYAEQSGMPVEVTCRVNDRAVSVQILDKGLGMPGGWVAPTADAEPCLDDLEALPEGGMGMQLIDQCVDTVVYEKGDSGNLLTFTKFK